MGLTIFINLLLAVNIVLGFNVDTKSPLYYSNNEPGSFFGYSAAFNLYYKSVIVGAPLSKQSNIGSGGAAYQCSYSSTDPKVCTVMANADVKKGEGDDLTNQWFGATVSSDDRNTLVCAPRFANNGADGKEYYLLGKCVNVIESTNFAWKPCAARHCQAGFSAGYYGDNPQTAKIVSNVVSGVPTYSLSDNKQFEGRIALAPGGGGNTAFTNNKHLNYSDYMGYAVTSGKFSKDKNTLVVVGGSPRGNELAGKVIMYKADATSGYPVFSTVIQDPSKKTGTYFGSALAAVAIEKAKEYSDLVIGAPYYSEDAMNAGAVYVYKNSQQDTLELKQTLYGDKTRGGLFGYSVVSVGDLNSDSFNDVAVGAPWGGPDGKGAVYLYYGTAGDEPFLLKQKLYPKDLGGPSAGSLDGFGFSIAEFFEYSTRYARNVNDIDRNGYPDLAIGAYRSNQLVLFKSRPVISVKNNIDYDRNLKIDLYSNTNMCINPADGKKYKCIKKFDVCFTIITPGDKGDVTFTVDIDKETTGGKRGFVVEGTQQKSVFSGVVTEIAQVAKCQPYTIYLRNNTKDVFREMIIKISWTLKQPTNCQDNLCPITNQMSQLTNLVRIPYIKGCSDDGNPECNSDLSIVMQKQLAGDFKTIQVGITKTLNIVAKITNKMENAFINTLKIVYPKEVNPNKVVIKDFAGTPVWDPDSTKDGNEKTFSVTLASPIGPNKHTTVTVEFGIASVAKGTKKLTFIGRIETLSVEMVPADNVYTLEIPVSLLANLTVTGNVEPEQLKWNKDASPKDVGAEIIHTFYFQNLGPSTVDTSDVVIQFPERFDGSVMFNIFKADLKGTDKSRSVGTCTYGKLNTLGLNVTTEEVGGVNSTAKKLRARRAADTIPQLGCGGSIKCREIKCTLGLLQKGAGATVKITSSLVDYTFQQLIKDSSTINVQAKFTSTAVDKPKTAPPDTVVIGFTAISPNLTKEGESSTVEWWIIFICILVAILIIAVIVFIMYKKGFFKRKKMGEDEEEEELRKGDPEE
uniref:Integrin alpha chain n=1 Tax=Podocoryna carnea TaxID=6096 RepID=Q9GSF4_PODCA|nr:integrin alpha chain [Podocoryna carnea]